MPAVKLHLEQAEFDAVARLASELNIKPEAIVFAGLNRIMLYSRSPKVRANILETWVAWRDNLPLWSDSAQSVHAYEGKADDDPSPSRIFE